jgi:hypothetical protein
LELESDAVDVEAFGVQEGRRVGRWRDGVRRAWSC